MSYRASLGMPAPRTASATAAICRPQVLKR